MSVRYSTADMCTTCGSDRGFEQPICAEGHGADCPELCCLACGLAVMLATTGSANPVVRDRTAA